MSDAQHANGFPAVTQFVENAIDADPDRQDAFKSPTKKMPQFGAGLEQGQGFEDGIGKTPIQCAELRSRRPCQKDTSHRLGPSASLRVIGANLVEGVGPAGLDLRPTATNIGEGLRVGQDLRRLLKGFVFVDGNDSHRRTAPPSNNDMLAQIGDLIENVG